MQKIAERPISNVEAWTPETEEDIRAVREQLERLLATPLFRNSKRFPRLLRHIVEQTLSGNTDRLRERVLGVDVFNRDPDYDSNADPIVRTTAGEVRKRIAQYYHEAGHADEMRIDLPLGTYVPEFRLAVKAPVIASAVVPTGLGQPSKRNGTWLLGILFALIALTIVPLFLPMTGRSSLDLFWDSALASSNSVLICVGAPDGNKPSHTSALNTPEGMHNGPLPTLTDLLSVETQNVALSDAIALAHVAGLLQSKSRSFQVQNASKTNFEQLRQQPIVLIGAFNNDWTQRFTRNLRFSFGMDPASGDDWIRDRQTSKQWRVSVIVPYSKISEDYAIAARLFDTGTERPVVIAAGIWQYGTEAAGEFLTNSKYLDELRTGSSRNWLKKNIEVVLRTQVIDGNPGPPRVVSAYFW